MDTIELQGLVVSAQGLGCMGMSHGYGTFDDRESIATLNLALDLGVSHWDTADIYGEGANERLLATVLATRRDEVTLTAGPGVPHRHRRRRRPARRRLPPGPATVPGRRRCRQRAARAGGARGGCPPRRESGPGGIGLGAPARERLGITIAPIPGTKRRAWLRENVAALDLTLEAQDLAALQGLADDVTGARYSEAAADHRSTVAMSPRTARP